MSGQSPHESLTLRPSPTPGAAPPASQGPGTINWSPCTPREGGREGHFLHTFNQQKLFNCPYPHPRTRLQLCQGHLGLSAHPQGPPPPSGGHTTRHHRPTIRSPSAHTCLPCLSSAAERAPGSLSTLTLSPGVRTHTGHTHTHTHTHTPNCLVFVLNGKTATEVFKVHSVQ